MSSPVVTTFRMPTRAAAAAVALLSAMALTACEDRADAISTEPPEGAGDRGVLATGQIKMSGQVEEGPAPVTASGGESGTRPSSPPAQLPGTVSSMGSAGAGPAGTTGSAGTTTSAATGAGADTP